MTLVAVVPVKAFASAKQRLRGCCTPAERAALARAMLHDVLDVLVGAPGLAGVVVVTADRAAAALAARCGAGVLAEAAPRGLNAALGFAAQHLVERGASGMLVVPADVPGLTRAELQRLVDLHDAHAAARRVTLVPAHDGDGTNAIAISPPDALQPAFGAASFARHRDAARAHGLRTHTLALPGLALDIDRPEDVARYARSPSATRSWRLLAALAGRAAPRRPRPRELRCAPPLHAR